MADQFKSQGDAEWDQRQAFHQRLHNAIMFCYDSMHNNDYMSWHDSLLILYTELASHMSDEEQVIVDIALKKAKNVINYENLGVIDKKLLFHKAQLTLHKIMRSRGFDVPVVKHSPGSILMTEKSY